MMSTCARAYSDRLKQMHDRRAKICEPCEFKSRHDECPGWYWPDISCPKGLEIWGEMPSWHHDPREDRDFGEWLEKVKKHIEWLASYIHANQLIVNQFAFHDEKYWWKGMDLNEMQEDAENWKKFCSWTLGECIEARNAMEKLEEMKGFKIDAEKMARKLNAIQTWYDSEKGYNTPGFEKLGDILEVPKSTSRLIDETRRAPDGSK